MRHEIVEGTYEMTSVTRPRRPAPAPSSSSRAASCIASRTVGDTTARMLDWRLPVGQDHYFKAISELAASGGLIAEKVMEINKTFDTNFLSVQ